jgi:hypothetical protein
MADNVTLNAMTGGSVIAADDISSVFYQRVKLTLGADATNDGDVSSSNPIPAVLTAGSAAIGKLAANSGVDIGDVDVTSVPTDPFGANADAASATGSISAKLRRLATDLSAVVSGSEIQADIVGALPAGTNAIGKLAANSGVDIGDVDILSIAAGSNLIGNVGIGVRTSGGATPFYNLDVDETEDAIKASAGQLYELYLFNTTAAPLFVKLYNATTANVTVGTTTPLRTIPVPANADSDGAGVVLTWPMGLAFSTAITIACTTAAADNDTGAPGAGALIASGAYN